MIAMIHWRKGSERADFAQGAEQVILGIDFSLLGEGSRSLYQKLSNSKNLPLLRVCLALIPDAATQIGFPKNRSIPSRSARIVASVVGTACAHSGPTLRRAEWLPRAGRVLSAAYIGGAPLSERPYMDQAPREISLRRFPLGDFP
jgi:hypothetical protein